MKMTAIIIIGVVFLSFIAGCAAQQEDCTIITNSQERMRCYASNAMITAFGGAADSHDAAAVECEKIYSLRDQTGYGFEDDAEAMQGAAMCISEVAIAVKDSSVCNYLKVEYFANSGIFDMEMQRCLEYST